VDLTAIFEPEVQVCWWPRARDPALGAELASPDFGPLPHLKQRIGAGDTLALGARTALAADVAFLAEVYCDLVGCTAAGLRLQSLDDAMCPRFHVDRTGIRLLCTYRGPGTQWLHGAGIDRQRLQEVPEGHSAIGELPGFAVGLLKGSAWPGNGNRGAIHRSPPVPAGAAPRVLLTLDALWAD
jgi:hypothetical protein